MVSSFIVGFCWSSRNLNIFNAMAIRCDIHLNGGHRKLILAAKPEEPPAHLALKLAAFVLCWAENPIVDPSAKHPALLNQEFRPDLMALDDGGGVALWVECGPTSLNKLEKLPRRFPHARFLVLKESRREGDRLRRDLTERRSRGSVTVWSWREEDFALWAGALEEKTEIYGEADGRSLNLVINQTPLAADLTEH